MKIPKPIICLLPVLLAFYNVGAQQQPADSLDYYIAHLNWNSSGVTATYIERFELAADAKRLVSMHAKDIEQKLYAHIGDTDKTVAIYAILAWRHQDTIRFGLRGRYHYPDSVMLAHTELFAKDTLQGLYYTVNGLQWYYDLNNGNPYIEPAAVEYAKEYWRRRIRKD